MPRSARPRGGTPHDPFTRGSPYAFWARHAGPRRQRPRDGAATGCCGIAGRRHQPGLRRRRQLRRALPATTSSSCSTAAPTTVSLTGCPSSTRVPLVPATSAPTAVTLLSGSLPPGQYYLVQQAGWRDGGCRSRLPTRPGTVNMSATGGKVALVNSTTGLACNGGSTPCSAGAAGPDQGPRRLRTAPTSTRARPAPTLSNTTAACAWSMAAPRPTTTHRTSRQAPRPRATPRRRSIPVPRPTPRPRSSAPTRPTARPTSPSARTCPSPSASRSTSRPRGSRSTCSAQRDRDRGRSPAARRRSRSIPRDFARDGETLHAHRPRQPGDRSGRQRPARQHGR